MARAAVVLLGIGVVTVAASSVLLARSIGYYLDHPLALSSTSGNVVFTVGGEAVQYAPFRLGAEPMFACIGLALIVVALALGAATYRARSASRDATAEVNADAQIR